MGAVGGDSWLDIVVAIVDGWLVVGPAVGDVGLCVGVSCCCVWWARYAAAVVVDGVILRVDSVPGGRIHFR